MLSIVLCLQLGFKSAIELVVGGSELIFGFLKLGDLPLHVLLALVPLLLADRVSLLLILQLVFELEDGLS